MLLAVSEVVRFKNPNEPLQGHLALTEDPTEMMSGHCVCVLIHIGTCLCFPPLQFDVGHKRLSISSSEVGDREWKIL